MPETEQNGSAIQLEFPESELVFALVYPVGTDYSGVLLAMENYLKRFNYRPCVVRLSDFIPETMKRVIIDTPLDDSDEGSRITSRMAAGNELCLKAKNEAFLVSAAVARINQQRKHSDTPTLQEPLPKTAHILHSLKRPQEVELLRAVYGSGFYLVGVFASENDRLRYLTRDKNIRPKTALTIMKRDEEEEEPYGQRSRRTFQLADVFIQLRGDEYKAQLERFLDLVFGNPYLTPEPDEFAMFMAYSAALRSGQLARQVGAAIRSEAGDLIAVGCNDVPAAGGGLYWPPDSSGRDARPRDQRDHVLGFDSNDREQSEIVRDVIKRLDLTIGLTEAINLLKNSRLMDITEYGRAVHAEMDALLACARTGISPVNSTVFTTTFPCHNCTRHIIASGVRKVLYIEPYPKSLASKLHKDAIDLPGTHASKRNDGQFRIPFEPFVGIGPRRFYDLFSMRLSSGYDTKRKDDEGLIVRWKRDTTSPRVQMLPTSYTQREKIAAAQFMSTVQELEEQQSGIQRFTFPKE